MEWYDERQKREEEMAADDEIEVDEVEERACRYALQNDGASEVDLIAVLRINRIEAHYLICRMIDRKILKKEIIDRRHPLYDAVG